jgi:hypothetical protein
VYSDYITRLTTKESRFDSWQGPPQHPDWLWGPHFLQYNGYYCFFSGVNWPGHKASHSPPSFAEVRDVWWHICTPSYIFMAQCLIKHTDSFTLCYISVEPMQLINSIHWTRNLNQVARVKGKSLLYLIKHYTVQMYGVSGGIAVCIFNLTIRQIWMVVEEEISCPFWELDAGSPVIQPVA